MPEVWYNIEYENFPDEEDHLFLEAKNAVSDHTAGCRTN
jgi:hypothetical protein